MVEIIPAIMPYTAKDLEEKLKLVTDLVDWVQIDIMDGIFVPEKTLPFTDEAFDYSIFNIQYSKFSFELDLMVRNAGAHMQRWLDFHPKRIIFHIEAETEMPSILDRKRQDLEYGIAFDDDTPIDELEPFIEQIDFIQCMGIDEIGKQGEPFEPRVLENLANLREKYPSLILSVDGGVNLETAKKLIAAGASRLVVGSSIFGADDPTVALRDLKNVK